MNPIARELNDVLEQNNKAIFTMLSQTGKKLFFPKGILTQTAEAKEHAGKYNATIGIAKEDGKAMYLPQLMNYFRNLDIDEITPYAPSFGQPLLRKLWREHIYEKNSSLNKETQISLPVFTNGITHGLSLTGKLFVDPGDTVILPDKIWGNYRLTFEVDCGAEFKQFPFFNEENKFNTEDFEKIIDETAAHKNKTVIILNFPNNPTGYTPSKEEAQKIADILIKKSNDNFNIIAVCDDAYFGLYYEDDVFCDSIFSLIAGKNKNLLAIKLDGATKEDYVWGFRCGFITYGAGGKDLNAIYDALEKKTAGGIRSCISNCSNPAQSIMTKLFQDKENYLKEKEKKYAILKKRANRVKKVLADAKYSEIWDVYPFNSGYFMCVKLKGIKSEEYRKFLLHNYGVGVISPNETDIRVAFSCIEEKDIEDLFQIMYNAALEFKSKNK